MIEAQETRRAESPAPDPVFTRASLAGALVRSVIVTLGLGLLPGLLGALASGNGAVARTVLGELYVAYEVAWALVGVAVVFLERFASRRAPGIKRDLLTVLALVPVAWLCEKAAAELSLHAISCLDLARLGHWEALLPSSYVASWSGLVASVVDVTPEALAVCATPFVLLTLVRLRGLRLAAQLAVVVLGAGAVTLLDRRAPGPAFRMAFGAALLPIAAWAGDAVERWWSRRRPLPD